MKRWLFLLCVLCLPAQAAPAIQQWQSPSGAKVLFVEIRTLPILDIAVDFRAGSAFDAAGQEGLARLTHALVKAGSRKFSEAEQGRRLADVGAVLRDSIDRERSGYRLRTLSSQRERTQAIETFAALLQQPAFADAAHVRERATLASNTREEITRPEILVQRRLFQAMYEGHPYSRFSTGESVEKLSLADVEGFHQRNYSAARAIVTIVGDLSREEAARVADALTADLPKAGDAALPDVAARASGRNERIPHHAEQSHIMIGVPAIAQGDADYFPMYVGNFVLGGGGFVSRLYDQIREKRGLAYSVYSYVSPMIRPGPFIIGLQTQKKQTDEALATVRRVLDDFVARGPTARELEAAKKSITGGFPLRIDSNSDIVSEVAFIGFYGLPLDWLDRFVPAVRGVTAAQIRDAFARRVAPATLSTVIVGAPD
jgi:zinc protease